MTTQTLQAAITEFAHGYLALRADESTRALLATVPAAYIADLYPYCHYEQAAQPIFDFIKAAEPGGELFDGQHWSPILQNFFNGARYLMYAQEYGRNGGAPPARISRAYLASRNVQGDPVSYQYRYNREIKRYLQNGSALADLHYISEWDTLACFIIETVRLYMKGGSMHDGDLMLTSEEQAWFRDMLNWSAFFYQPAVVKPLPVLR